MPPHHLHRCGESFTEHRRAQDVVTIDHTLQCIDKYVQTRTTVECDQIRQQIGIAFALQQVMEKDTFLQWSKRIDILDIGRAARGHCDDAIDLLLSELHQRQHFRRDLYAIRLNAVRRHNDR